MKTIAFLAILLATFLLIPALAGDNAPSEEPAGLTSEPVGRDAEGRTFAPVNQVLTPMGRQIELAGLRPRAVALSPDGKLAVASTSAARKGGGTAYPEWAVGPADDDDDD